jgi:hypothetical protein
MPENVLAAATFQVLSQRLVSDYTKVLIVWPIDVMGTGLFKV